MQQTPYNTDKVLTLKTQQGELYLSLKNIVCIEGERNYSNIYLNNGKKELVSKTLSNLEDLLEDKGFFRCHKSYLINKSHIIDSNSLTVKMSNNNNLPISRRKKDAFKHWLENIEA